MLNRRFLINSLGAAAMAVAGLGVVSSASFAQDVTLRMHQFLPPQANVPKQILFPWAERVEKASGGRIKIEIFSAMALGGTPPQLIDQARDGVVDIVWTLPGYSPGRFPRAEVFELPFMMTNAEAASRAYWQLFDDEMKDADFKDFKILGAWVHGPGVIHSKGDGVRSLADMSGKKLRGPTRVINDLLKEAGATPVGMPVPAIPEALSKGVIDGAVIPWEVAPALKIAELVDTHTEFGGDRALYTATFVLAMNKQRYDAMPDDLKAILDDNTGLEFSAMAGRLMQEYDAPGRKIAEDSDNDIVVIDGDALAGWQTVAEAVVARWISEMDEKGIDGQALLDKAKGLIEKNSM
ncbi:TRAP transporter substrate-binding protein [Pararhizobium sp. IMCC21322]|uniref:TRAP transporter substrate-binding protein n=1 Tax=Pararhizobium sp. IMCC21322 TaxID=3067903 RepID=UPI002741141E|nr:TRAP transporter substrate-binding protein [Pararhizobium sp. IMCC21322]